MVRANEYVDAFLENGFVAFGGERLGKLSPQTTKEDLLKLYGEKYSEEKEASRASWASQLLRLMTEVKIGDDVTCADRERRRYLLLRTTNGWRSFRLAHMRGGSRGPMSSSAIVFRRPRGTHSARF